MEPPADGSTKSSNTRAAVEPGTSSSMSEANATTEEAPPNLSWTSSTGGGDDGDRDPEEERESIASLTTTVDVDAIKVG